jgi:hypothetical protein
MWETANLRALAPGVPYVAIADIETCVPDAPSGSRPENQCSLRGHVVRSPSVNYPLAQLVSGRSPSLRYRGPAVGT